MHSKIKLLSPAFVLTLGLTGMAQADNLSQTGSSDMHMQQIVEAQTETINGTVKKVEGDVYTINNEQGKELRLRIEQDALQGKEPKEGDKIQAKVLKGGESYNAISAQKEGQSSGQGSSMQAQSASGKQDGQFTKTINGEIKKVEGNVYYVQDSSGKEIRLRLDKSAQTSGDLKEGDKIEALVTKEKELHVISAEPAQ